MKKLDTRQTFHLEIPASESNLRRVRDFIADICTRADFSKRESNNIKLAVDEACTNIIKHAYGHKEGKIRLDVQAEQGRIEVNIYDQGESFDWSGVEDPDLEEYVEMGKKGGLGIFLMNRLMDELQYQPSSTGNHLYMAKQTASRVEEKKPLFISPRTKYTSTLRFKFGIRAIVGLLGLILLLWGVLYVRQTREVETQLAKAWLNMTNFAQALEARSENALVTDEELGREYTLVTDYIQKRLEGLPAVAYAHIINDDGIIVSSSSVNRLLENYAIPEGLRNIGRDGKWKDADEGGGKDIKELHLPIILGREGGQEGARIGRVVVGVSTAAIRSDIEDPRMKMTLILGGVFLIGVALVYFLVMVLVKPIQALTDGVRAVGEGSLDDDIKVDGPEEIGEIARAFNQITSKFREAQKNVVEQERLQKEMQVAQEIQHSLLPKRVPEISGYDIASLYKAAKEVGGDYYDFVVVDEDTLGVVVGDVSGKGVPGSLVMTMIRTALRMEARGNLSANQVMSNMNNFVTDDMKRDMFVTVFYVILDSKNRVISYASAGHNPMILYRAESEETFSLNPRGFPVGISLPDDDLFSRSIDVEKVKLKKDDMLIIYTDGVTEAMNEDRKQFGEERLIECIKEGGKLPPQEFIDQLTERISAFTGDMSQNDDITVVAIKEKLMADDVLFGIRKKLLDLVEVEGLTVADACKKMNVSPSTYYRYRKRLNELGEEGLRNKQLRREHEIRRLSHNQRRKLLAIIEKHPEYGAKRIWEAYISESGEEEHLSPSLIYQELKRMRLNNYRKRIDYLRRKHLISEEKYEQLKKKRPVLPGRTKKKEEVEEPEGVERAKEEKIVPLPPAGGETVAGEEMEATEEVSQEEELGKIMEREGLGSGGVEIKHEELGDEIVLLIISGNLDSSSAEELEEVLERVYRYGINRIVVDLSKVSYISSGGWGIFTGRVKSLRERKGDVVLVGMSPEVYDIYELLGFRDIIMHFQTVEEGVEYLSIPFEERRRKIKERTGDRDIRESADHRLEARGEIPVYNREEEGEEGEENWTPLVVQAGTVGKSGEITVLYLHGVVDTVSSIKLNNIMDDLIDNGKIKLVVDMSRVEYVSSSGWGVFASRIDEVRTRGGDIKIFGMTREVDTIFELLGFDVVIKSFSILPEAIDDFEHNVPPAEKLPRQEDEKAPSSSNHHEGTPPVAEDDWDYLNGSSESGRWAVLKIRGAVDASTTSNLESYLQRAMEEGISRLVIDLSNTVYINSSGWGMIVNCFQEFSQNNGRMVLAGMDDSVYRIFCDLGFEPLIPTYHSAEKALEEISSHRVELEGSEEKEGGGGEVARKPDRRGKKRGDKGLKESHTGEDEGVAGDKPRVDKADLRPIERGEREKSDNSVVYLNFEEDKISGKDQEKDRKIKELGWGKYGEKLARRNRKKKNDQKE